MGRSKLQERIDAEFAAADERIKQFKGEQLETHQGRQERLEKLDQKFESLRGVWVPRLEALAAKFGERVAVTPRIEKGKRSATFDVKSELASVKLRFGVAPDSDVRRVTFTYDLEILPILMKFESHSEIEFPLDEIDDEALGRWFDDRIIGFVKSYLALYENQYYLKDHMVEDPVAKVRFPKFAAGATAQIGGKTYYFIDEATCREFKGKK